MTKSYQISKLNIIIRKYHHKYFPDKAKTYLIFLGKFLKKINSVPMCFRNIIDVIRIKHLGPYDEWKFSGEKIVKQFIATI